MKKPIEQKREDEFDLSGLLLLQRLVQKHAPNEERMIEKLEFMIRLKKSEGSR